MSLPEKFKCYLVEQDSTGRVTGRIAERRLDELPQDDVLIRVAYSSLNYKDALAATGHPGVNKTFPHIPGVDAAGVVVASGVYEFVPGDKVIATGFDLGSNRWGGYAEYVAVPHDWVVPLPEGLSLREAMILGTAGVTAGIGIDALVRHGVTPDRGEVVVSGASGGVGSVALAILARLGYRVAAISGKPSAHDFLRRLGATDIVAREEVDEPIAKGLLSARWAGGIDTVGGNILSTILRAVRRDGCVATCGTVAGTELHVTVYPFVLRGVTLSGIDAAWCPLELRHQTWQRLAGPWKPERLEDMARFCSLEGLSTEFEKILGGQVTGRVVIEVGQE